MAGNNSIQFLRGTSSQRGNLSEQSLAGQPLYETDTRKLYIGDGSSAVKDLKEIVASDVVSKYNLGAYDTFTDNGDGTVTITRKTYTVLDYASLDWYRSGNYGSYSEVYYVHFEGVFDKTNTANMLISNNSKIHVQEGNEDYTTRMCDVGLQIIIPKTIANGDVDAMKAWLNEGGNIIAQIPLATSYTEEVILDQPIHTLDVNGEQFVRNEWEKGLNINSYSLSGSRSGFTWTYDENDQSLTFNGEQTSSNQQLIFLISNLKSGYYTAIIHVISGSFTTATENTTNSVLRVGTNHGKSSYNSGYNFILTGLSSPGTYKLNFIIDTSDGQVANFVVMNALYGTTGNTLTNYKIQIALYEGDVDYPFYPYNGAIVHEKQLNKALDDYLPLTGGTMSGEIAMDGNPLSLGGNSRFTKQTDGNYVNLENANFNAVDGIIQEGGQRVYSPNNPPPSSKPTVTNNSDGTVNITFN